MSSYFTSKCCKPLKGIKCCKVLRNVLPWMQRKVPSIQLDQKICDKCRKSMIKWEDVQLMEVDRDANDNNIDNEENVCDDDFTIENVENENVHDDEQYFDQKIAIECLNKFLNEVGEAEVEPSKLKQKSYCELSLARIVNALKGKIFVHYSAEEESSNAILDQIKDKFHSSNDRSERIKLLTLVSKNWSLSKIVTEFEGASNRMIRISKKLVTENGILSSPNIKCGRSLQSTTVELVHNFYTDDDFSRLMPGKKDYVSVKTLNGRTHLQKRLVLCNLRELYQSFKARYPDVKLSFLKFAMMRPENCVLAGASGTHSVCVCTYHQNPKLMLDACKLESLEQKEGINELSNYKSLLNQMICRESSHNCYLGLCKKCPGPAKLQKTLSDLFEENQIDSVTYKQWTSTDRSMLQTIVEDTDSFISSLIGQLTVLLRHSFVAKQQSQYLRHLKETLTEGTYVVVCDFSENYSFVVQDATQGYHWNNIQATIHPFIFYYTDEENMVKNDNFIVISDCLKHDSTAVHLFQTRFIQFLKENYHAPTKILYFSDGCSKQYKNKNHFLNVSFHETDFKVSSGWHFFATSHGKNACDGLGGTIKRLATKASLQRPMRDQILTPKQMHEWASTNILGMNFNCITNDEYVKHSLVMNYRYDGSKVLKGTLKKHAILPVKPGVVKSKLYSFYELTTETTIKSINSN